MTRPVRDIRQAVEPRAGIGRYGHDFGPRDWRLQRYGHRLSAVLNGTDNLRYTEMQELLARVLIGR